MHIESGRIFDVSLRKSVPIGSTTPPNQKARAELQSDIEAFLRSGGTITTLPGYQPAPPAPHRAPPKPSQEEPQDELVRGKGRRAVMWPESFDIQDRLFTARLTYAQLAEITGVPRLTLANWFQKHMIPSNAWKTRIADGLQTLLIKHGKGQFKTARDKK